MFKVIMEQHEAGTIEVDYSELKTLKSFKVGKLYYAAKIIVKDMTIEKMNSYDMVAIYKIEKIYRGCVYYSRWIYSKGVIARDEKFYNRNQKTKGIKGHQWYICDKANCEYVSKTGCLYAVNECTLLKVAENGEIVIADTGAKVEVEEYAVNVEAQEIALQAEIANAAKEEKNMALIPYVEEVKAEVETEIEIVSSTLKKLEEVKAKIGDEYDKTKDVEISKQLENAFDYIVGVESDYLRKKKTLENSMKNAQKFKDMDEPGGEILDAEITEVVEESKAVEGWEVVKDEAGIFNWTYYKKYPVEGYGAVEVKNADETAVYSVSCSVGVSEKTIEFFIKKIAKTSDILVFVTRLDTVRKTNNGDITFCGGNYDVTFSKGTVEENKAAAFAYANYIVEYLRHFEKTAEGYRLNQEYLRDYIYGVDTAEEVKKEEHAAKNNWINYGYDYKDNRRYTWIHEFKYGGEIEITSPEDFSYYHVNFENRDRNGVSVYFSLIHGVWKIEKAGKVSDSGFYTRIEKAMKSTMEKHGGKLSGYRDMVIVNNFNAIFDNEKSAFEYAEFAIKYLNDELAKVDAAILKASEAAENTEVKKVTNEMIGLTFSKVKKSDYYYCNFKAMQIGEEYFPARRIYVGASSRNAEAEIEERKAAAKVAIAKNLPITPKKTAKSKKNFESGLEINLFSEEEETPKEAVKKFEAGKYYAGESSACNAYIVYKCISRSEEKVTLQESWLINEVGEKTEMRGDIGTFKITVHRGEYEEVRLEKRRYVWACSLYEVAEEKTPKTEETVSKVQYWSYEFARIIEPDYENVSFLGAEYVEKLRAKYEAMEKEITGYKEELGDSGKYRLESVVYRYGYDNEMKETVSRCRVIVEYTDGENRGWTATASQIWLNSYTVKTDVKTGEIVDEWGSIKDKMLRKLFNHLPDVKETKNVNEVYNTASTAEFEAVEETPVISKSTIRKENTFVNVLILPYKALETLFTRKLLWKIKHALETILGRIRGKPP